MNAIRGDNPHRRRPGGGPRGPASSANRRHQGDQSRPTHGRNGAANAQKNYERYLARARDAAASGDMVEMENCYQHAEHYFRVMRDRTE